MVRKIIYVMLLLLSSCKNEDKIIVVLHYWYESGEVFDELKHFEHSNVGYERLYYRNGNMYQEGAVKFIDSMWVPIGNNKTYYPDGVLKSIDYYDLGNSVSPPEFERQTEYKFRIDVDSIPVDGEDGEIPFRICSDSIGFDFYMVSVVDGDGILRSPGDGRCDSLFAVTDTISKKIEHAIVDESMYPYRTGWSMVRETEGNDVQLMFGIYTAHTNDTSSFYLCALPPEYVIVKEMRIRKQGDVMRLMPITNTSIYKRGSGCDWNYSDSGTCILPPLRSPYYEYVGEE